MNRSKKISVIVVLAFLFAVLGIGYYFQVHRTAKTGGEVAFSLPDEAGKMWNLEELRGHPVVLHFWAAWCPPCVSELPEWLKAARASEGKSVKWVAVSLDPSWPEAHAVLPKDLPKNVLALIDLTGKTPEAFGTYQFPESYLLDRNLKVVHKWVGGQNWASPEVQALIQAQL